MFLEKVTIVIPTYNEADNISDLIISLIQIFSKNNDYTFNILVVDDNSPDGTGEIVDKLNKKYPNINLLSGPKLGLGKAYSRGLEYVLKNTDTEIVVIMDADLSHDPNDLPRLLNKINEGADYVIGSRYVIGGKFDPSWPLTRVINSKIANFAAHKLVGIDKTVNDLTAGYKAIRISALNKIDLSEIEAKGYVFNLVLFHEFFKREFKVYEVPITFSSRSKGYSKLKFHDILEFVYQTYKLNPSAPIQRIVRFCFVGACGAIVNILTLSILIRYFNVNGLVAVLVAIEISIIFNFTLNHRYTFRGYGSYKIQSSKDSLSSLITKLIKYNIGIAGGAIISFSLFALFYKVLSINYLFSDVLAIAIATSWNYFVSSRYVWKVVDQVSKK